jgi:hypothetical protein
MSRRAAVATRPRPKSRQGDESRPDYQRPKHKTGGDCTKPGYRGRIPDQRNQLRCCGRGGPLRSDHKEHNTLPHPVDPDYHCINPHAWSVASNQSVDTKAVWSKLYTSRETDCQGDPQVINPQVINQFRQPRCRWWYNATGRCATSPRDRPRFSNAAQRSTNAFSMTKWPGSLWLPSRKPRASKVWRSSSSMPGLPHIMMRSVSMSSGG